MLKNLRDCFNPDDERMQGYLRSSKILSTYIKDEKKITAKSIQRVNKIYGKEQVTRQSNPRLYSLFEEVYRKLNSYTSNTLKRPKLYLSYSLDPEENAYATTDDNITITYDAAKLSDAIIKSIIAHEFGHIIFNHCELLSLKFYIYSAETEADMLANAATILSLAEKGRGDISKEEALDFIGRLSLWGRMAELTADNVACLCDGSANPCIDFELHCYNQSAELPIKSRKEFIALCYLEAIKHGDEYFEEEYFHLKTHPHYVFRVKNAYENMGGKPILPKKRTVTFTYKVKNAGLFKRKKPLIITIEDKAYRIESEHSITLKIDIDVREFTCFVDDGYGLEYPYDLPSKSVINLEYDVARGWLGLM